ncbi:MAG: GntR family transcriptional regulator [Erysipelotrichaceae bacterium]|nr:GntR family transcriptional regulator [Erysipelotrichaceae bacterium]
MEKSSKYRTIENYIRNLIDTHELNIGDQIMTEEQLCKQFNFSRMTVNKALNHLNAMGYITRIPGKGSFVSAPHVSKNISSHQSFSEDMKSIGLIPGSKLLSYELKQASDFPSIQEKLKLQDSDYVHYFMRLRTGNNKPIAVSYTYVSRNIVPTIELSWLDQSFYDYIRSLGIQIGQADYEFKATLPTEQQKELLQADSIATLCCSHLTFAIINGEEVPFEYVVTYYNSDMYSYKTTHE